MGCCNKLLQRNRCDGLGDQVRFTFLPAGDSETTFADVQPGATLFPFGGEALEDLRKQIDAAHVDAVMPFLGCDRSIHQRLTIVGVGAYRKRDLVTDEAPSHLFLVSFGEVFSDQGPKLLDGGSTILWQRIDVFLWCFCLALDGTSSTDAVLICRAGLSSMQLTSSTISCPVYTDAPSHNKRRLLGLLLRKEYDVKF